MAYCEKCGVTYLTENGHRCSGYANCLERCAICGIDKCVHATAAFTALLAERDAARHTALTEAAATCRMMTAFFPDALVDGAETCASAIEHLRDTTPSPTGTPNPTDLRASEDR